MANAARKLLSHHKVEPHLEEATVVAVDEALVARTADGDCEVRRAKSCLVAPSVGDRVLLAFGQGRTPFVLAVLEGEAASTIAVDGDLDVKVRGGRFAVSATEGVEVVTGGALSFVSKALQARAFDADLVVDKLSYVGALVRAELDALKTVATTADSVFERVSQRVKRSFRFVEDSDNVKAGRIDYAAKSVIGMRAKNTIVAAEELVKVDAEQIQLG
jgi:hypothetical protein